MARPLLERVFGDPFKTSQRYRDSPPYLRDGSLRALRDTAEFFDSVLEPELNKQEREGPLNFVLCR